MDICLDMKKIEELKWHEFDIKDIFPQIMRGRRLKIDDHIVGDMPYVSSSAMDNGVDNFVSNDKGVRIFFNCLTIANSGSVGATFYHPYRFVASDHVTSLSNTGFNKYVYLFIATVVRRLSEKYSFNREIKDPRLKREIIMLPIKNDGTPDYGFMEEYMKQIERKFLIRYKKYLLQRNPSPQCGQEIQKWGGVKMTQLFNIFPGVRLTKQDQIPGDKPFVGSTDSNNGITAFCGNTNASEDENVLGVNYNGSVVENFYHPYKALFSDDVKRFHLKNYNGNKYIYLYLKNCILKQQVKYQYGYKFNEQRMKEQVIMIPLTTHGDPGYHYMEDYMRNEEQRLLNRYIDKRLKSL